MEVNFNIWRERPSTCRVKALRRYEEQTNLSIKSISGRRHLDSGRSILNLSWNYLIWERMLGLRGSSKHSELREQFTVFHFAYLCSWKMFCYWSKAIGPMQGTPGTFLLLLMQDNMQSFSDNGLTKPARKVVGSKIVKLWVSQGLCSFLQWFWQEDKTIPNIIY